MRGENETADVSEEIMTKTFTKLMKDVILKRQGGRASFLLPSMGQVL